jgi:uncharacterized SAM-binding protein YcdF (DUF218 family)
VTSAGPIVTEEALAAARVVWNYHYYPQQPIPGDAILTFGTNDTRVAEHAADLWHRGFGKLLVMSGGVAHQGDLLAPDWSGTEAEVFRDVAEARGVPREHILLEIRATNTAENIRYTRALFAERGIDAQRIVLAVKPFMRRRVWATMAADWPEMPATMASPGMTLDEYFTRELPAAKTIHIMMGDLQRLWIYAAKGWSARHELPKQVAGAYRTLVELGFTQHLIKGLDPFEGMP